MSWRRTRAGDGSCARAELDQALAGGLYYGLQLGVDLQFRDHVADVPLDRVRRDSQPVRHRCGVQTLGKQAQDVELPRSELRNQLLTLPLDRGQAALPGDRTGEQLNRDEHLAPGRTANRFDDLVRSRVL